jgi:hypothetical protein
VDEHDARSSGHLDRALEGIGVGRSLRWRIERDRHAARRREVAQLGRLRVGRSRHPTA